MNAISGRDGMVKRMLLLSDGEATSGVRDVPGFRRIATRARDMGCTISTVGVVPGIRKLTDRPLPINLAVSMHAANDAVLLGLFTRGGL